MQKFVAGQRWMSEAEPEQGLGLVLECGARTVEITFPATGESRNYARQGAPLRRVRFEPGDTVHDQSGRELHIATLSEQAGLLTYSGQWATGEPACLPESELDHALVLNRPSERLFLAQIDTPEWFELRRRTWQEIQRLLHSDVYGLSGARTQLIAHQLYIAHEVATRHAPRVLLADEVGLGKTIEAGLIVHQQLLTERARRVLIVVPESLVHQWLVEMRRRFNLRFSVFDEARCRAVEQSSGQDNPFAGEQLVLCQLDFLTERPERLAQACAADWDLLVVDEAHHLQYSEQAASIEYQTVEQLARQTPGVLLLTATPEQLGKAGHFARLHLLDPNRFADLDAFVEEERHYAPIARAIEALVSGEPLDEAASTTLNATLDEGDNRRLFDTVQDPHTGADEREAARTALIEHLLDRHGTGRVLFRNTRSSVKGFPKRRLEAQPLALPPAYATTLEAFLDTGVPETPRLLCPESVYRERAGEDAPLWTRFDPRIDWLLDLLKRLRGEKILLITAEAQSALELAEVLRRREGVPTAVFHKHMSLLERDRAAAYFAEPDSGARILLCSEIGSEGRNFQFAHHLVLFDLPLNPELLEQRIGRLDRIGQREDIRIHVPYLQDSAQEVMFHWYHSGLDAFAAHSPAAQAVFERMASVLIEALHQSDETLNDIEALSTTTQELHDQLKDELQRGRDRLLEYNACRPEIAATLTERARALHGESELLEYLEQLFDCLGIDSEVHAAHSYVIRPGEHMQDLILPDLDEEGLTVTWDRATALAHEDWVYLNWEHPLLSAAMDQVLSAERGNTALSAVSYSKLAPGKLLLECIFILQGPRALARYVPPTALRIVVDGEGRDHAAALTPALIQSSREAVTKASAVTVVEHYGPEIRAMIKRAEALAEQRTPALIQAARERAEGILLKEIERLKSLRLLNPNVREDEIRHFEDTLTALKSELEALRLRQDALRVIVTI